MKLHLAPGEGVRVWGPAGIRVESGLVTVLGAEYGAGAGLEVPGLRSYYLEALEESVVEASLAPGGRVEQPQPGEEPLARWIEAVDEGLQKCDPPCTVVMLGPVDSGKTSLAALAANRAMLMGLQPAVIDADIGQADIGPPGFLAASLPSGPVLWLRGLEPDRLAFAGHLEPGYVESRIIAGALKLRAWSLSRGAGVVVVDTDGWVEGWHALEYKLNLLRALDPGLVVVAGDRRLHGFIQARWPGRVEYLPSPAVLAERSASDRRRLRQSNYRRFLEEGETRILELDKTPVLNSCLAPTRGQRREATLRGAGRVLVSEYPGGACVLVSGDRQPDPGLGRQLAEELGVREVLVLYTGGFRGVLISLVDPEGWDHPGVVESLDLDEGTITVRTPYRGPVRMVVASRIRLGEDYSDTGARRIWI